VISFIWVALTEEYIYYIHSSHNRMQTIKIYILKSYFRPWLLLTSFVCVSVAKNASRRDSRNITVLLSFFRRNLMLYLDTACCSSSSTSNVVRYSPLKPEVHLEYVYIFSSYLTGNTPHLCNEVRPFNTIYGNNCSLLWESYINIYSLGNINRI
jgi:hypothetical protein